MLSRRQSQVSSQAQMADLLHLEPLLRRPEGHSAEGPIPGLACCGSVEDNVLVRQTFTGNLGGR
jgi:hypothetical protein